MDVMHNSKPLERFIAAELARRADRYNPELIIPVPTGSNKIGELVARKLGIEVAFMRWLDKTPGQKSVDFRHTEDEKAVQDVSSVLVLEDVYTTGESSHAVASHPLIAEKLLGVLSIWSRLDPNNRLEVDYPTPTIIDYPVPLLVREPTSNG